MRTQAGFVIASLFFDGTARPMVAIIALCAIGATVLTGLTLRAPVRSRETEVAEPAE